MIKRYFSKMKGQERSLPRQPFNKIIWSGIGSFIGIYLISIIPKLMQIDMLNSMLLVASFGASAVLVYGAPQADFSQPRNLIGGHVISAIIGITVYKYINLDISMLGALAVSLSIIAMQFTSTMHPPGGATALIAIIGGDTIHNLNYMYVFTPIAVGASILLIIALVVNNFSNNPKRHYPRCWF